MKIQIEAQQLRFRIDEAELAELLAGRTVDNTSTLPSGQGALLVRHCVNLTNGHAACSCDSGHWQLLVPRGLVEEHARQLPRREGLRFTFDTGEGRADTMALHVTLDIDVRDSARRRFLKE